MLSSPVEIRHCMSMCVYVLGCLLVTLLNQECFSLLPVLCWFIPQHESGQIPSLTFMVYSLVCLCTCKHAEEGVDDCTQLHVCLSWVNENLFFQVCQPWYMDKIYYSGLQSTFSLFLVSTAPESTKFCSPAYLNLISAFSCQPVLILLCRHGSWHQSSYDLSLYKHLRVQ